jgi:hypothetical protein
MTAGVLAAAGNAPDGRTATIPTYSVSSGFDNTIGLAPRRKNQVEAAPLMRVDVRDTGRFTTQSIGGPAAPSPALDPQAPFVAMAVATATQITADGVLTTADTVNWQL